MKKFNRFVAKHHSGIFWLSLLAWFLAMLAAEPLGIPAGIWGTVCYVGLLAWTIFIGRRRYVLLQAPAKILTDQCDPYPYLEELQVQKDYSGPKIFELSRMIAECGCLSRIVQSEKAYQQLAPLQDQVAVQLRQDVKANYCGTMMMLCIHLDKPHEVETWRHYFAETYGKIRSAKIRQQYEKNLPKYDSAYYHYQKDYGRSMQALEQFVPETMMDRVDAAWSYGRNYMALGEKDKAREAFTFVVENGNRFDYVAKAQQLLEELQSV